MRCDQMRRHSCLERSRGTPSPPDTSPTQRLVGKATRDSCPAHSIVVQDRRTSWGAGPIHLEAVTMLLRVRAGNIMSVHIHTLRIKPTPKRNSVCGQARGEEKDRLKWG